ncbi:Rad17-domain-containing protein [Melanomma pulvis-pyrius CBS 109.77]|uniref:Rad17-domain-containing protein n=1 Tax=Melanomma pulvis-pyrius CBS 109.77 TaxID=1314802 RepID=A0A6A6XN08_9PLEO|nr:Rad17-domain-containing protein [Melanomma pulvis-pyrius CBS 109.77]
MGKPRAVRKKPVVLSSDTDEDRQHSPPPKRPKRGTPLSGPQNGAVHGDSNPPKAQTRRALSPIPSSSLPKHKSPAKSPGKPKPIYKPITSFFSNVPRPRTAQPTPSPEKLATSTSLEDIDDILDSEDDLTLKRPVAALPMRKRGIEALVADNDSLPKGSQRFRRATNGTRSTPPPSQTVHTARNTESVDTRPWNERYGPSSVEELAVHKKKVADVRMWLSDVFNGKVRKRLLLLKGPAGSGKTATMSLLSKELGFEVHEWKNPTSTASSSDAFVSVTAQFEDFVGRSGTFGSLTFEEPAKTHQTQPAPSTPGSRHKQLILVEEFPNTFARASSTVQSFRSSVLNFLAASTPSATAFFSSKPDSGHTITPIVMIISETLLSTNTAAADSFTAHRLLGPEILTHPGVTVLEFNPIAPTFMTKALDLIVQKEARKSGRRKTVGPKVIQQLSEFGDIRSAASSLEFLCVRGDDDDGWGGKVTFTKKKGPKDAVMTKMERESLEMITHRESTLGIFHAVGKVVHNKRIPELNQPVPQPPHWFPERRRPKVSEVNIDTLIDELGTDTQTFIAALHENYVLSCGGADSEETMDSIDGCIEALSDADLLSPDRFGVTGFGRRNFQGTSADNLRQEEISFQVSVRGLLYSLPSPVKRLTPPPGTNGVKGKLVGTQKNAFSMYYPTSLRIWRTQEEIGGLLDMWITRAQKSELFTVGTSISKSAISTSGVDSWRKTTSVSRSAKPTAQPTTTPIHTPDDSPPPILLGSGGSARYEMLLERLPYLPTILRKYSMPSPSTTATIREIRKITSFTGGGNMNTSLDDDQDDDEEVVGENEQWSTDRPGPETPKKKRRNRIEGKKGEPDTALSGIVEKTAAPLVLSDDDIED